jgi:hypothetical protein
MNKSAALCCFGGDAYWCYLVHVSTCTRYLICPVKIELVRFGILSAALADGSSKQSRIIVVCQQTKKTMRWRALIPLTDRVDYFTVTEYHFELRKLRLTPDGMIIIITSI